MFDFQTLSLFREVRARQAEIEDRLRRERQARRLRETSRKLLAAARAEHDAQRDVRRPAPRIHPGRRGPAQIPTPRTPVPPRLPMRLPRGPNDRPTPPTPTPLPSMPPTPHPERRT